MIIEIPTQLLIDLPIYGIMIFGIITLTLSIYFASFKEYIGMGAFLLVSIIMFFITFLMLGYIEVKLT